MESESASGWMKAGRQAAFLAVILVCAVSASAQFARKRAAGPSYAVAGDEVRWETFLVKDAPEPTLRFPVVHQHAASGCSGELFITRNEIRYVVKSPEKDRGHSFTHSRQSLTQARQWRVMGTAMPEVEYKFAGGGTYHFFHIRESTLQNPSAKFTWDDVLPWEPLAQAALEFDQVVATAQQRLAAAKPKEVTPPVAPPKMRIMEPAIPDPTQPVEVSQPVVTLRGAALDSRGVLSVMVADRQAEIRSTGDIRAVEFVVTDIPLREGLNRVNVVTTNVDRQAAQMEVLLWYRPPAAPVPPPVPVPIETETTTLGPPATPAEPMEAVPLHKDEILQMVRNQFPSEQIVDMVKESGIDFEPTDEYFGTLRNAGAKEILIDALRGAKRVR